MGVAGVVTLVWQNERAGTVDPVGVAAAVGAVLSSSLGFVLVKRWAPREDVLVTTTWQLVAGGLLLVPLAAVVEGAPPALDVSAVLALAYLGLVGSAVGYLLWFRGLTRMDAGAVAVVGLVNPVVGTALGVALLAEPFGPVHLAAVAVTLGSVLVAQARCGPASPRCGRARPTVRTAPQPVTPCRPDGRGPAYRGFMAPVSTATLSTPTGPVEIPTIGFGVWQVPERRGRGRPSARPWTPATGTSTPRAPTATRPGSGRALAAERRPARRRLRDDQGVERRPRS